MYTEASMAPEIHKILRLCLVKVPHTPVFQFTFYYQWKVRINYALSITNIHVEIQQLAGRF